MPSAATKCLVVLTGPTAVGKTQLCLDIAEQLGTEIVSADARQCYQGMRIGTAQPTEAERARVPHHLVGFLPVTTPYSAAAFAQDALQVLQGLWQRHAVALLTGGSGFYIQALCQGLAQVPAVDQAVYRALQRRHEAEGLGPLCDELARCDPETYRRIDRCNPRRVLRALAVCRATGTPYSAWVSLPRPARPFHVIQVGLRRAREVLYERIDRRVVAMMAEGLVAEAAALYRYRHHQALQTIGYRELMDYFQGRCTQPEAIRQIQCHTRRYAKRQLTWLRSQPALRWFDAHDPTAVQAYIDKTLTQLVGSR